MDPQEHADHDGSPQIEADPIQDPTIEGALLRQVTRQQADGELDDRHAGVVALARAAARRVDRMSAEEKGYSAAALLTAAAKVFDMLPKPIERSSAEFDAIVDLISDSEEPEDLP